LPTKMIFQIKHTRENFFNRNFFKILAVFFLVLILIFVFGSFGPVRSLVMNIASPFFKVGNFFYNSLNRVPTEDLRGAVADYESVKYENQKLREELKIKPTGNFVSASIIAKSPQIPLDSLLINMGTKDGINNGDFVLASDRVLIGRIVEISGSRSTVALNSFAGVITYGFVARTEEPIEIKGAGGGTIEAKVPINFDIVVGDKIMVGGSTNYMAAVAGVVEEDSSSGFKNVLMSLPVSVSKIGIVFVEPVIK
jgi:cell shape-determining protein MreC